MTDTLERLQTALADRYRIEREIGQGGMATVYLAEDVRHHRKVAIKVLRPELAAVLGVERFLREIELTAQLQHPHILTLYDSGQVEQQLFYVMPYIDGESLADRLTRERQLSVEDTVRITCEVADALDYAHRHGVVHRDIKPANVLLQDGRALVADFGIARAVRAAGADRLTGTGLSLGTPSYMSPEQAAGDRAIDGRSDQFSLACMAYEMLVGEPPHAGPTVQAIIGKLLAERPKPPTAARPSVPPHVETAILRALEKLPADRFATAAEFAQGLTHPALPVTAPGTLGPTVQARRPGRRVGLAAALAVAAIAVAIVAPFVLRRAGGGVKGEALFWNIVLPDTTPLAFVGAAPLGVGRQSIAITRDGRTVVYVAARGTTSQLFVRRLTTDSVVPLPQTEGAYSPFLSPDDQWVGYFVGTELRKAPLAGGPSVTLAQVSEPYAAAWSADRGILVSELLGMRLSWVSAAGGRPEPLRAQPADRVCTMQLLPRPWALTSCNRLMELVSLETGEAWVLTRTGLLRSREARREDALLGSNPVYVGSGYIVFLASGGRGTLMALPFDLKKRQVLGAPMPVLDDVRQESEGAGQFSVSDDGVLVYAPGPSAAISHLVSLDRAGRLDTLPGPPRDYGTFRVSPDGKRVLAMAWPPSGWPELWMLDLDRRTSSRVPEGGPVAYVSFDWTPDSREIVFSISGDTLGEPAVLVRQSPASASPTDTIRTGGHQFAKLASDGRRLALYPRDRQGVRLTTLGDTTGGVLLEAEAAHPYFSPNGTWVAYTSRQSGASQVVVAGTARPDERYPVSDRGGEEPIWLRSGRQIVYRNSTQWMIVDVAPAGTGLRLGRPRLLFQGRYHNVPGMSHDVFPDGLREVLLLGPPQQTADHINVVTNFFAELRRQAPPGRNQ